MSDEVKMVRVTIRPPKGFFAGEIAEGWYCVVDNAVVLTDADGKPVSDEKRHLNPGDDPRLIACRLVRDRRFGNGPRGFNDKLQYPKLRY